MIQVYYRMTDAAEAKRLQEVCQKLQLDYSELGASQLNLTLGEVIGMPMRKPLSPSGVDTPKAPVFYAMPEVILFGGLSDRQLDDFLAAYKAVGIHPVKFKAVVTPTNVNWSLYELIEQLKLEAM